MSLQNGDITNIQKKLSSTTEIPVYLSVFILPSTATRLHAHFAHLEHDLAHGTHIQSCQVDQELDIQPQVRNISQTFLKHGFLHNIDLFLSLNIVNDL